VVSDGGPVRLRSALIGRLEELHIPKFLGPFIGWLTVLMTSVRLGTNLYHYEPVRWVNRISPRPILFIHGKLDQYLPDFEELFATAGEPKQAWRVPGVGHCKASEAFPEEFYRRVLEFFTQNL
jgi:uncharacterized protein